MGGTAGGVANGKVHPAREKTAHKGEQSHRQTKIQCAKADNANTTGKERYSISIFTGGVCLHDVRRATGKLSVPTDLQPGLEGGHPSPLRRQVGGEIHNQPYRAKAPGPAHVDHEQAGVRHRGAILRKLENAGKYEILQKNG